MEGERGGMKDGMGLKREEEWEGGLNIDIEIGCSHRSPVEVGERVGMVMEGR